MGRLILIVLLAACVQLCLFSCKSSTRNEEPSALSAPDDLQVTLWAESPLFYNPTNIDIDSKGRVWVTEALSYRDFNNDTLKLLHPRPGDRVMILEDLDDDGIADTSKVYIQDTDLIAPLGIAVIGHKVYISCSPNLIVYTDVNGDDIPDKKEIFLTGFGGFDHDHSLHAVIGGPDGNLYFNTGNAGPHIVKDHSGWTLRSGSQYTGGTPYNTFNQGNMKSDDGKVWVGGLGLKIKPDGTGLKVVGHNFRNSYELIIDSRGDLWQNDNDDQVVACRTTWLMEGGNAGFFSTDGTRSWQADQRPGQDIFDAHWHQEDPGTMPAGDRSGAGSPTGVAFNESDALGKRYRGTLLSAEAGRNVIFAYQPVRKLSGYDLGARTNLVTSLSLDNEGYVWDDTTANKDHNKWFRPSDVAIGTEGALYIADWYDPVVGGHQMKDSVGYGRIYKVAPKGRKLKRPILDLTTSAGLLTALMSPAINVRFEALSILKETGFSDVPAIKKLLNDSNPFNRSRAIWLLAMMGPEGIKEVENLLNHVDEDIKIVAYRALRNNVPDILPYAQRMNGDTSPFIHREILHSITNASYAVKRPLLLAALTHFNASDRWFLEALGKAVEGDEELFLKEAMTTVYTDQINPAKWSAALEALVWRLHPLSQVKNLEIRAADSSLSSVLRTRSITALGFIKHKSAVEAMLRLSKSNNEDLANQAVYWLAFRQNNEWQDLYNWSLWNRNPALERKLAEQKVKLSKILDTKMPFNEKKWNAQDMAKDSIGGNLLLASISKHQFPQDLFKEIDSLLLHNKNLAVRIQAAQYFSVDSNNRLYNIPAIAVLNPDPAEGKKLFDLKCSICHRLGTTGASIGPDLQGIHLKFDRQGLLDAVINPSAGIVFGYEAWTINTKDGLAHYGFVVAETKKNITLKELTGKNSTLSKNEIVTRIKQNKSLMPSAGALTLSDQALADLCGYLLNGKK